MALKQISSNKCFEGFQKVFEHDSIELKCKMRFGIYLPPKAEIGKCPVLYWLSGLTCTEQNFITKSGFHQAAAEHGLIVVAPDTSPRKCLQRPKFDDESWSHATWRHVVHMLRRRVLGPAIKKVRTAILGRTKGPSSPVACHPTVSNIRCPRGNEQSR
uniref:S-formylglutathione hydrolase n=1 Tax=Chrysemys picta bellii TaxID=8478 RepID=A0A8C3H645_CHRPI